MKNLPIIKLTCTTLAIATVLTGCAKPQTSSSNLIPTQVKTLSIYSAETITLNGPFAINIHTGNKAVSQMTLYATPQQLAHVAIKDDGQSLTISDHNFGNTAIPIQVNITDPSLRFLKIHHAQSALIDAGKKGYFDLEVQDVKQLTFKGKAVLPTIKFNNSQNLIINDQVTVHNIYRTGQGNIVLHRAQGNHINITNNSGGGIYMDGNSLGFNQIKQTGNGEVQINSSTPLQQLAWVNNSDEGRIRIQAPSIFSQQFTFKGSDHSYTSISNLKSQRIQAQLTDDAQLNIRGKNDLANVSVADQAKLLARHLVNRTIYITSNNLSYAVFTVNHSLFANANDQSLIEYAGHPYTKFAHTMKYATILALSPPK